MPAYRCNPHDWESFKVDIARTLLKILIDQRGRVVNLKPGKVAELCLGFRPSVLVVNQAMAAVEELVGSCVVERRNKVYISSTGTRRTKTYRLYAYVVDVKCAYNSVSAFLADKLPFNRS